MVFEPHGVNYQPSSEVAKLLEALKEKKEAQDKMHRDLEAKLMAAANSCTTRKALVDLLPEFEKYLPAGQAEACKTLPAVANIMADFVKAGWPAGKQGATA